MIAAIELILISMGTGMVLTSWYYEESIKNYKFMHKKMKAAHAEMHEEYTKMVSIMKDTNVYLRSIGK